MARPKEEVAVKAAPAPPLPPPTPVEVLHKSLHLLDKYAEARDALQLARVLRYMGFVRAHCAVGVLRSTVETYVADAPRRAQLIALLVDAASARPAVTAIAGNPSADVEMSSGAGAAAPPDASAAGSPSMKAAAKDSKGAVGVGAKATAAGGVAAAAVKPLPVKLPRPGGASAAEVESFLWTLVLSMAAAARQWAPVEAASRMLLDDFYSLHNRRTLDFFQARTLHYLSLASEVLAGGPHGAPVALRPRLLGAHRTSTLRHDDYGAAVAINLLLRSYLSAKEVQPARALLSKVTFPEAASTPQLVRFQYYQGRVRAVLLEYSAAQAALLQASRKAPPAALAFRTAVAATLTCVQLLSGEIPERSTFASPDLAPSLGSYLALTRAVRRGDVEGFRACLHAQSAALSLHGTYTLAARLEASVIKTGLRRVASAYSRISFVDVATRLRLGSPEDAEFLSAKAIRDGVLDATLDHEGGVLLSRTAPNVYATREPQEAFHRRIAFCMDVHTHAVRSLRYPPRAARADLESAEARRAREEEDEARHDIASGAMDEEDDEM